MNIISQNKVYTNEVVKNECFIIISIPEMFIIFMQGRSSPERVEFDSVPVCHRSSCPIRDPKGFALSKSDRKTYSSSALHALVPEHYFCII